MKKITKTTERKQKNRKIYRKIGKYYETNCKKDDDK